MQDNLDFEVMLERMQEIAAKMEGGRLKLEEAMALYTEGMMLSKKCAEIIEDAKQKVEIAQKQDEAQ